MNGLYSKPDIEFNRKMKNGLIMSYGHIYWKPFILAIHLFNRTYLIRDKKLRIFRHKLSRKDKE